MHHEVNAIEHDFAAWHNARMSIPVILDKRLEELFEVTNKKPFDIDTEDPYEEVEYYFLVSENMGIITTPLNSSEYTNTFGKHLFGAKPIKDGSRRDAIKALQPNGPAEKIMEDVTVLVLKAWKKKGEDDKKRILADAYSKLNGAAKTSPGAYKALLLAEADLIARRAASEFKMSLDELVDLAGEA
jgi:hypothetical protein